MATKRLTVEEKAKKTVNEAETCRLAITWATELRERAKDAGALGPAALDLAAQMLRTPRTRSVAKKASK